MALSAASRTNTDAACCSMQTGQALHLSSLMQRAPATLASGEHIRGAVVIDPSAEIGKDCVIGPDVSIGPNAVIADGVRLRDCVIMQGCTVRLHLPARTRLPPALSYHHA